MKNPDICHLPKNVQDEILNDVRIALTKLGLPEDEIKKLLEDAANSKLYDLEDTIDIKKYITNH